MSDLKWPYVVQGGDGKNYTPEQAKTLTGITFTLTIAPGVELTPVVGAKTKPHWRSTSDFDYMTAREGYEMTEWHYQKQMDAQARGCEIEYKIEFIRPDGTKKLYWADAYDPATNTAIEYVHSCFDPLKIADYWQLGLNQQWVFDQRHRQSLREHNEMLDELGFALRNPDLYQEFNTPTITIGLE